jgi:hypothetical protein
MRLQRALALLTTTAVAATTAVAFTAPIASASDYCDWEDDTRPTVTGYSPTTVVVGLDPALVKFSVKASDECGIDDWIVSNDSVFAYKSSPGDKVYGWWNSDAGSTYMDVMVADQAYNVTEKRFSFKLLRKTRWTSFNASPEPVRKGGTVTVTGTLQRADWDYGRYVGYGSGGKKAKVQFKKKGSSTWTTVKTVSIGKGSKVSTKVSVKGTTARDGSYRLYFAGNSVSSTSASTSDYVDVK